MDQGVIASMKQCYWANLLRTLANEDDSIIILWGEEKKKKKEKKEKRKKRRRRRKRDGAGPYTWRNPGFCESNNARSIMEETSSRSRIY
jgi:hypothetical protein